MSVVYDDLVYNKLKVYTALKNQQHLLEQLAFHQFVTHPVKQACPSSSPIFTVHSIVLLQRMCSLH